MKWIRGLIAGLLFLLLYAPSVFTQTCPCTLPPGMTFDGTTLVVPRLSLTSGAAYAAGQYIVTFDTQGNLTYTPYVPPSTGNGGGANYQTGTLQVPATAVASGSIVKLYFNVPSGMTTAANDIFLINADAATYNADADCCVFDAVASGANTVLVRIRNLTGSDVTFPATNFFIAAFAQVPSKVRSSNEPIPGGRQ